MRRRRRNPALAVIGNPRGRLIGHGVREIVYDRHATHGRGPWVHKFRRGDVDVRGLKSGKVEILSRAGARVWEKDGRAGWLSNKPAAAWGFYRVVIKDKYGTSVTWWDAKGLTLAQMKKKFRKLPSGSVKVKWFPDAASGQPAFAHLKKNRGGKMARSHKRKRKGNRKPPRGFRTWAAYMASIRPGSRRKAAHSNKGSHMARRRHRRRHRARHRRPRVAHVIMNRGRRGRRRGFRRNPVGGLVGRLLAGAKGGIAVVAGKIVARAVPQLIGITPVGVMGVGVQTLVGSLAGIGVGKFVSWNVAEDVLKGVFASAYESLLRGANVPFVSPALGDETELYAIAGVGSYPAAPALPAAAPKRGGMGSYPEGMGSGDDGVLVMA